jgi:NADH-quinone oxidoreductase subunit D
MPELRTETMTVNMGPQHPSTHGVLRLVLELEGETVVRPPTTIGYLHTGIEKTPSRRSGSRSSRSSSGWTTWAPSPTAWRSACRSRSCSDRDAERVKDIRVLIAELQRSQPPGLARHARARDRRRLGDDVLLPRAGAAAEHQRDARRLPDVPELHPDRRPARGPADVGFHEAVNATSSTMFPGKLERVRGPAHEEPDLAEADRGVGIITADDAVATGWSAPWRAPPASPYDVRRAFPYLGYETYEFDVPTAPAATSTTGTWCGWRRCARACGSAAGARAHHAARRLRHPGLPDRAAAEGQGLHRDGRAHPALPDLLAGLHRAGGDAYVPVEGPRGEHGFSVVSDGTNRPYRIKLRAPSFYACQALPRAIVGGMIADVIAVIGSTDVVMGDVDR